MTTKEHKTSKYRPSLFQGRMDFTAISRPHVALAIEHPLERMALRGLYAAIVILIAAYLYFVSAAVLNVMARREALTQITRANAAIGSLEGNYFSLSHAITPQTASSLGLSPIQSTEYVNRPGNVTDVGTKPSTNEI